MLFLSLIKHNNVIFLFILQGKFWHSNMHRIMKIKLINKSHKILRIINFIKLSTSLFSGNKIAQGRRSFSNLFPASLNHPTLANDFPYFNLMPPPSKFSYTTRKSKLALWICSLYSGKQEWIKSHRILTNSGQPMIELDP